MRRITKRPFFAQFSSQVQSSSSQSEDALGGDKIAVNISYNNHSVSLENLTKLISNSGIKFTSLSSP